MTKEFKLNVWKCHPKAARIEKASKHLNGTANEAGVKMCRPYGSANQTGWWLWPPVDMDVVWRGDKFERNEIEPYTAVDRQLVEKLIKDSDQTNIDTWCPEATGRTKFTWGEVEPELVQIWSGLIFETPPGWCLLIRSPINCGVQPYHIMEGILETDWMQYDIWFNVVFDKKDEVVKFRKDQWPPLAQIIPIRRETVDADWEIETNEYINRDSPEADRVFSYWAQYNDKKFCHGGKQALSKIDPSLTKDGTTFHKERRRILKEELEPDPATICPHLAAMKQQPKIKTRFVKKKD